jgi:hypothetical protein
LAAIRVFPLRVLVDIAAPFPSSVAPARAATPMPRLHSGEGFGDFCVHHRAAAPTSNADAFAGRGRIWRIRTLRIVSIFKRSRHAR